jgi:hypothetical protein
MSYQEQDGQVTHDYGCECWRCRLLFAAITAKTANGYLFSDEEFARLARLTDEL